MRKKILFEVLVLKVAIMVTCITNVLQILDTETGILKAVRANYIALGVFNLIAIISLLGAFGKNRKLATQLMNKRKSFVMMTFFGLISLIMNKQLLAAIPLFESAEKFAEYNTSLYITFALLLVMILIEIGYINIAVAIKNVALRPKKVKTVVNKVENDKTMVMKRLPIPHFE